MNESSLPVWRCRICGEIPGDDEYSHQSTDGDICRRCYFRKIEVEDAKSHFEHKITHPSANALRQAVEEAFAPNTAATGVWIIDRAIEIDSDSLI